MDTWTDTVYSIPETARLSIVVLDDHRVALTLPGYCLDGRGFSIYLSTAHLPAIKELHDNLAALDAKMPLAQLIAKDEARHDAQ